MARRRPGARARGTPMHGAPHASARRTSSPPPAITTILARPGGVRGRLYRLLSGPRARDGEDEGRLVHEVRALVAFTTVTGTGSSGEAMAWSTSPDMPLPPCDDHHVLDVLAPRQALYRGRAPERFLTCSGRCRLGRTSRRVEYWHLSLLGSSLEIRLYALGRRFVDQSLVLRRVNTLGVVYEHVGMSSFIT